MVPPPVDQNAAVAEPYRCRTRRVVAIEPVTVKVRDVGLEKFRTREEAQLDIDTTGHDT